MDTNNFEQQNDETEVQIITPNLEVIYQQDKAQTDVQIATAKAYPRNIKRAVENAVAIVSMSVETATTCNFALPRGGKILTGPSVHLAKILAQNWGNMRIGAKVVNIDAKQITSQGVAFDLENNLLVTFEVKRSIMTKNGRMSDDMITVTGNAANAIALRNAIFAVIPKGVTDNVYNAAKKMITGDVSDKTKLLTKRKQVLDTLKDDYNVTEKEVLATIGKASVTNITADDLAVIIGIGQAIKDGDTTVETAFKSGGKNVGSNPEKEGQQLEKINELLIQAFGNLTPDEENQISDVIKNKVVNSYEKTIALLESKIPPVNEK